MAATKERQVGFGNAWGLFLADGTTGAVSSTPVYENNSTVTTGFNPVGETTRTVADSGEVIYAFVRDYVPVEDDAETILFEDGTEEVTGARTFVSVHRGSTVNGKRMWYAQLCEVTSGGELSTAGKVTNQTSIVSNAKKAGVAVTIAAGTVAGFAFPAMVIGADKKFTFAAVTV